MELYWVHEDNREQNSDILRELKKMISESHQASEIFPEDFSMSPSSAFFEGHEGCLWMKFFEEAIGPLEMEKFLAEVRQIARRFELRKVYGFAPKVSKALTPPKSGGVLSPDELSLLQLFEYSLLRSGHQWALALKPVSVRASHRPASENLPWIQEEAGHFYQKSRLNRGEIEELLELDLSLKSVRQEI